MFVPDNRFVDIRNTVDNIRINITDNSVVDDFVLVSEILEKLFSYGERIDEEKISMPPLVAKLIFKYENMKAAYLTYIYSGGRPHSRCFCGRLKNYKNCHGQTLKQMIKTDLGGLAEKS